MFEESLSFVWIFRLLSLLFGVCLPWLGILLSFLICVDIAFIGNLILLGFLELCWRRSPVQRIPLLPILLFLFIHVNLVVLVVLLKRLRVERVLLLLLPDFIHIGVVFVGFGGHFFESLVLSGNHLLWRR